MNDDAQKMPKRKYGKHLRVPVLVEEELQIKESAKLSGLSIADYLRRLALGYKINSVIDQNQVLELAKINGDLGRLGGLLKLWLTKDKHAQTINPKIIVSLLEKIKETQNRLFEVVNTL